MIICKDSNKIHRVLNFKLVFEKKNFYKFLIFELKMFRFKQNFTIVENFKIHRLVFDRFQIFSKKLQNPFNIFQTFKHKIQFNFHFLFGCHPLGFFNFASHRRKWKAEKLNKILLFWILRAEFLIAKAT